MFGKKKRDYDQEEYEAYSDDEGYTPLFADTEEPEEEYGPGEDGAWSGAPGNDEYEEYDEYNEDEEYAGINEYEDESSWTEDDEEGDDGEAEEKEKPGSIFRKETRKPNFVVSVLLNTIRVLMVLAVLAGVAGLGALAGLAKGYVDTAPELNLVALDTQAQTSFIYDSNNNLITEYKGTENRVLVSLDAMPKRLRNAFIAVEDARFYSHSGIDLKRIGGAFLSNQNLLSLMPVPPSLPLAHLPGRDWWMRVEIPVFSVN